MRCKPDSNMIKAGYRDCGFVFTMPNAEDEEQMPKHRTSGNATRSGKCDGKNKSLSLQFEICWLGMMKTDDFRWCFVVPQPKLVTVTSPGMNAISHESIVASHGR